MHQWHFLIVAFFAVLQPIVSFTERNSVDGRRQCCEERDNSLLGDEKRSLHGSNRITQERQLKERDIRYARSEPRVSRLIADDRVNRMFTRFEQRSISRSDPQVNDVHRRERVGLKGEERNRESLRTRSFLQHSRVLRQNNQQDSYRKLSRENVVLEQTYNRREMRRTPGISRVIENNRKVRESRDSIANIRNDLALQSDRRTWKITVNEIRRAVEPNTNIILRDRQYMNRDRQNVMSSSKLERIRVENDLNLREREQMSSPVDNRRQIHQRYEVRLSRQIRTSNDFRQESRMSRENERDQMSRISQRDYIRISRDIRPQIRVQDTRRDSRNSRSLDVFINRNDASRRQSNDIQRSNRHTEKRNVREESESRDDRRMKDTRFRDTPNQKMRAVRWTEKRSDVTETRITRNRGIEREFVDSRLQNERSLWSRANNGKLPAHSDDKPVYTWQYLLYSLQTVYLGFLIIKMLSNSGSNKIKNRHFFWWASSPKLLKVD